jgi:hypothetical protein
MYTNLYLVEKHDRAHRADLLREAARDRQAASLHRGSTQLVWRAASKLGVLLVNVGNWLERNAQHSEQMATDA